jgi:hypothetical protein
MAKNLTPRKLWTLANVNIRFLMREKVNVSSHTNFGLLKTPMVALFK